MKMMLVAIGDRINTPDYRTN